MIYSELYPECKGISKLKCLLIPIFVRYNQSIKEIISKLNRIRVIANLLPGIQCVSDFVSSPWDTCNKCTCEDGKVTHNCTQFKTHSYTLGGLLKTWLSKFYFIGCPGNVLTMMISYKE